MHCIIKVLGVKHKFINSLNKIKMTIKISDLFVLVTISTFNKPKPEGDIYPKIFTSKEEAEKYNKSLGNNYIIKSAFIDDK